MVGSDSAQPRFTGGLLIWWIVVAAVNECLFNFTILSTESIARNWDDRTGLSMLVLLVPSSVLLIPVLTTTQWMVLRRGWPGLAWVEWLLVSAVAMLMTGLVWLVLTSLMLTSLTLLVIGIGCGVTASIATLILRHKGSTSVAIILFTCFLVGGMTAVVLQYVDLRILRPPLFRPDLLYMTTAALGDAFAAAVGAAISGFGLWMVSQPDRRALQNSA